MDINLKAAIAIGCVFLGCCSNVIFLELLVKYDPGSGNLITFLQFLFIAVEGFIFTARFGTKKKRIGLKDYTILVSMFFVASVSNNYAFDFNIPMPLHMIFRAGSLIANMIMGILILQKKYDISKYLSVFMITLGIVICTIVSGSEVKSTANEDLVNTKEPSEYSVFFFWTLGIALLTLALFISARMGIYQEVLYKRYGKYPREALYYTHLLPLPFFAILYKNIWDHIIIANGSAPYELSLSSLNVMSNIAPSSLTTLFSGLLPSLTITLPTMWVYLIGNCLTQYMCISAVYVLTTECQSLTVTLVVTLRKFVSLIISIWYFNNEFTLLHWIGTLLVFVGTIVFTEVVPNIRNALLGPKTNASGVNGAAARRILLDDKKFK